MAFLTGPYGTSYSSAFHTTSCRWGYCHWILVLASNSAHRSAPIGGRGYLRPHGSWYCMPQGKTNGGTVLQLSCSTTWPTSNMCIGGGGISIMLCMARWTGCYPKLTMRCRLELERMIHFDVCMTRRGANILNSMRCKQNAISRITETTSC